MALEGDWFGPQAVDGGVSVDDFSIFAAFIIMSAIVSGALAGAVKG